MRTHLCRSADDVWINAMIWKSEKQVSKAYTHSKWGCDYYEIAADQEEALSLKNNDTSFCRNDAQIKAVMDKYDLYRHLMA